MMTARMTLVTTLMVTGCAIDYGVNKSESNNGADALDSGLPDEPEPEEEPADGPVAVCSVSPNPVTPPFEAATWDGSGSYSDDSEIVDYKWALSDKPSGSAVNMPTGGARRSGFVPDLAGDYVGRLTVTDANGETDSCTVTLESVPAQNLWIEMFWVERHDDMDLHLIAPGGRLETNTDCYFANCVDGRLNWGGNGRDDDPSLDLDDIEETGPENINITEPEAGTYKVIVHDYDHTFFGAFPDDFTGRNDVTVNIYIDGALEWSDTRTITGNGSYTEFAQIDWTTGTVSGL